MATVDGMLAELELAGYDYRITRRSMTGRGVHLGVELCAAGALDDVRPELRCCYARAGAAGVAGALADALAQMGEKAPARRRQGF